MLLPLHCPFHFLTPCPELCLSVGILKIFIEGTVMKRLQVLNIPNSSSNGTFLFAVDITIKDLLNKLYVYHPPSIALP
jgi:hypothetical protein